MTTRTLMKTSLMAAAGAALVTFGTVGSASAASLITNGGFETGNFTGWAQSGNLGFTSVVSNPSGANSGNDYASLGPIGSLGYLSQTLSTIAGQSYQLSYYLFSDGGLPNAFQTLLNGATLAIQTNIPSQPYTQYSFNFVGTGSDEVKLGFQNNPGFLRLDDVSVTAVPTPALLPGLIGLGVGMLRKRKAEAAEQTSEV
jgi:hypothetical protein